ncbi:MAG: hypothetical protein ACRELA_01915 [Candidatus Rokuibacteriota bacterium]
MGGGTTVVEALRLGCKVIGIDLNPVACFIVKTEVEPVDLDELRAAFHRLAARPVPWSGKHLRETLLEQYKTGCPCCGSVEADIIHTFWVKSAFCTNAAPPCEKKTLVPLFSDYIVARKGRPEGAVDPLLARCPVSPLRQDVRLGGGARHPGRRARPHGDEPRLLRRDRADDDPLGVLPRPDRPVPVVQGAGRRSPREGQARAEEGTASRAPVPILRDRLAVARRPPGPGRLPGLPPSLRPRRRKRAGQGEAPVPDVRHQRRHHPRDPPAPRGPAPAHAPVRDSRLLRRVRWRCRGRRLNGGTRSLRQRGS